jgi:hypothetical protein
VSEHPETALAVERALRKLNGRVFLMAWSASYWTLDWRGWQCISV